MIPNTLKLVIEQTEGDKVLSNLTLFYPNIDNADANLLTMELVDAMAMVVRQAAGARAEATGSSPEIIAKIRKQDLPKLETGKAK